MRLESLGIKNYKTLEDVSINFDGYFASVSGQNNAGKTSVIRVIKDLFKEDGPSRYFIFRGEDNFAYSVVKTQWVKDSPPIEFRYKLCVSKIYDPGVFNFIGKFAGANFTGDEVSVEVVKVIGSDGDSVNTVVVDGAILEKYESNEVVKRMSSSGLAIYHNSTDGSSDMFFGGASSIYHRMMFTKDERDQLRTEQERLRNKVKAIAKKHKGELSELLERLQDKYDVELSVHEGAFEAVPLAINLKDKNVDIPLDEWGSGTKNRTQIMMAILHASKIKAAVSDDNRVTPIVVVEEPESFLHPSAQAEFGRVIRGLSNDLGVQIIITTHSPYMLCQKNLKANTLLDRRVVRGKVKDAYVVDIREDNWMEPFSNILGLNNEEFEPWKKVIGAGKDNVLLVEGKIDKEYLEFISSLGVAGFSVPDGIEILPYEGKDALKNVVMLKFVIEKFNRVFLTFDLDAKTELSKSLASLSLQEDSDFFVVGIEKPGRQCIEGLLPERVLSAVYSKNTDLVMQVGSIDAKERREAKDKLKKRLLDEFKSSKEWVSDDLKGFKKLFQAINKAFN